MKEGEVSKMAAEAIEKFRVELLPEIVEAGFSVMIRGGEMMVGYSIKPLVRIITPNKISEAKLREQFGDKIFDLLYGVMGYSAEIYLVSAGEAFD